jgi:hypothetical protein
MLFGEAEVAGAAGMSRVVLAGSCEEGCRPPAKSDAERGRPARRDGRPAACIIIPLLLLLLLRPITTDCCSFCCCGGTSAVPVVAYGALAHTGVTTADAGAAMI